MPAKGQLKVTPMEAAFIKENYHLLGVKAIAEILGKTKDRIDAIRRRLGIDATYKASKSWSKEEIDFLKQNRGKLTYAEIAHHLGKYVKAVDAMRRRIGLPAMDKSERMKDLARCGNHPMHRQEVLEKFYGENNPSCRPEVKAKISEIRKQEYATGTNKCGWKGPQKEPTEAENALMGFLISHDFEWNKTVGTRKLGIKYGCSFFRMDFANSKLKICIEIDGSSHRNRIERDARKDAFLSETGWTVLRFTNDQVIADKDNVIAIISKLI